MMIEKRSLKSPESIAGLRRAEACRFEREDKLHVRGKPRADEIAGTG